MSSKKKDTDILFLGSFLSRSRGTKGISETIAENLESEGIRTKLISRFEDRILRMIQILWEVISFNGKLIHIDVFSGNSFNIGLLASKFINSKRNSLVLTLHGGRLIEYEQIHPFKVQQLFAKANQIQTPSKYLQVHFTQKGYQVNYLPNPIQLDIFPYKYKQRNEFKMLWVRGFSSIYNPMLAIEILAAVKHRIPQVQLTMIGPDRGLMEDCKALSKKLNVEEQVIFLGAIQNDTLSKYYHNHDVFLNTTSFESFGVAVVEAASCGIPIVSSKVGELPLIWEEERNILFAEALKADCFAPQVIRVLEDRQLHQSLSQNARKNAEQFAWSNLKGEWLQLIETYGRS